MTAIWMGERNGKDIKLLHVPSRRIFTTWESAEVFEKAEDQRQKVVDQIERDVVARS